MIKINVNNLNLKDTITCGQIFRFKEDNDSYIVILKDRVVRLKYDENTLYVSSNDENNLDYYRKLLGYENTNYFITPYYDKFIVIKYCENEKPKLFIE